LDDDGLPTGLMISAAKFNDAQVLRIAHAYQQATDFHRSRPTLPD
jgi:aspartyl-tRNA(Asn)/glutamyl-tRNA(Gln) amidotransferase subunit A